MDLSKLQYKKGEPTLVPRECVSQIPAEQTSTSRIKGIKGIAPSYRKEDGHFSPNLIFVLSGGEKKEKNFLKVLTEHSDLSALRVVFMSKRGQGLLPYQMQDKWTEIQSSGKIQVYGRQYSLSQIDSVFLLTDVDQFYDQIKRIYESREEGAQGEWIVSNPCFEIWLYYCYLNNPEADLTSVAAASIESRSNCLKTLGQTLIPGGLNPILAFEKMADGIRHSESHYRTDAIGIPELFATDMHKMAQYIIDTLNSHENEFRRFLQKKQEWRENMRKRK